jgi:hypothetical protein
MATLDAVKPEELYGVVYKTEVDVELRERWRKL